MARRGVFLAALVFAVTGGIPVAAEDIGDAARGETVFKRQCSACHQIGPEAANRVGPRLNGIFGRRAGGWQISAIPRAWRAWAAMA